MKLSTAIALSGASARRQAVTFAKRLTDGAEFLMPTQDAPAALSAWFQVRPDHADTGTEIIDGESWFIERRVPAPRLLIIGAVHIAQTLAPFAASSGFDVSIIDPRSALRTVDRFPNIRLINDWPDQALHALEPDKYTAVVTLSHDPKLDDPALDTALLSEAFYLGALGSRKSHAARLERLAALGHPLASLARIHGPAGLPIAALSPEEIAVSILAQMIAIWRGTTHAKAQL